MREDNSFQARTTQNQCLGKCPNWAGEVPVLRQTPDAAFLLACCSVVLASAAFASLYVGDASCKAGKLAQLRWLSSDQQGDMHSLVSSITAFLEAQ